MILLALACAGSPKGGPSDDTASPTDTAPDADSGGDSGEDTAGEDSGEDSGGDDTAADPLCADAPVVTWASFGQGFLLENCQACHASTTENRYGAPEAVTFDTVDQAWAWADRILARATGKDPDMPPQGGVFEDDRVRLEWWLRCGTPGT